MNPSQATDNPKSVNGSNGRSASTAPLAPQTVTDPGGCLSLRELSLLQGLIYRTLRLTLFGHLLALEILVSAYLCLHYDQHTSESQQLPAR